VSKPRFSTSLEETKRISRILEIVQRIAVNPRRWRRKDLAEGFEISERQIQKDLDVIRHGLKLPLLHCREGYYFESLPRMPTVTYSFSEALALLLAAKAAQGMSGIPGGELAAALARLESLFPPEFGPLLRQLVLSRPSEDYDHRQDILSTLHHALMAHRRVQMTYSTSSRGGEESDRIVEPYYIMPYVRSWYLIAYDHKRGEVRMFKVDRIRQAELLEERYEIPKDFDLDEYLGPAWGVMRGEAGEPVEVVLQFSPEAGRWAREQRWHPSQEVQEQPDGSILFKLKVAITPEFVNWIMYYGSRVKVLLPESLRKRVEEEARRIGEAYQGEKRSRRDA